MFIKKTEWELRMWRKHTHTKLIMLNSMPCSYLDIVCFLNISRTGIHANP